MPIHTALQIKASLILTTWDLRLKTPKSRANIPKINTPNTSQVVVCVVMDFLTLRHLDHLVQRLERAHGEIRVDEDLGLFVAQAGVQFFQRIELHVRALVTGAPAQIRPGDE